MAVVHDAFALKKAEKRNQELEILLLQLDLVANLLYNNLEYDGVFELIQDFEELRLKYYLEHYENEVLIKNKGKING